ncbi:hypothetical protein [Myroides odoratimimus]|uniref:hypothetical protein n=1 Tax=Myroides odoratimimus TaxID=76832 RepID=UPI003D2F55E3
MKKYIIMCAALVGMSYFGQAQVGIGTKDPVKGSALEVQSDNKGVLLPRVSLASKTTLSPIDGNAADTKIKGLIVFNTNPNLDPADKSGSEGFYYWTGTAWTKLSSQDEIVKLIQENTSSSNTIINEIVNEIVNEGTSSALKGTSVVLYDFDKKEFYTLVKDKDGNIVTSTPIDLGLSDVVRYKEVDGKTVLVYKDKNGKEQEVDLNNLQVDTFIRDVKDKNGKVTGYVYFSEEKIAKWIEANPKDAHRFKTDIPDSEGKLLDIVGDVANNLQEIFNSKKDVFETFINEVKGNVTVKVEGDRTYLVYNDGTKEVKIDLSQLETETFVRTIHNEENGVQKIYGYVHFNEAQISKWIKEHPGQANNYKEAMKNEDGTILDVVGAISNNFKDIVNNNSEYISKIIQETKGNVTVKTENGKTYLVYRDDTGKEVVLDLSAMELVTFSRELKNTKNVVTGYVYFNEDAIAKWLKENPLLAPLYQTQMPDSVGFKMDVLGTVNSNFEEIINNEENKKYITNVINESTGNVTVKVIDGKTVLVFRDKDGKEEVIDLSSQEVDTFVREIKDVNGKLLNYVYFSELAITEWQKANSDIAKRYKTMMPDAAGTTIDVIGAVSQNFEEIIKHGDNIKNLTEVIQKTEGNVTVKEVDGKMVIEYIGSDNQPHILDLSSQEVDTFVLENIDPVSKNIINYVYFGEAAITEWQKANPKFADEPKKYMKATDAGGVVIDVVGAVSQNFEEIIKHGDNIKNLTEVIQKTEGNVTVKEVDGKMVIEYIGSDNQPHILDLSSQEVDTFIQEVKDTAGKVTNYIYYGEAAIATWQKANPKKAEDYKELMKLADGGVLIDVVGTVANNFEEIINQGDNVKNLTNIINKEGGNVFVEVDGNGKTYLVYKDKNGDNQKVDLSTVETLTFIRDVKKKQIVNNVEIEKVVGYVYFSEEAIAIWKKDNAGLVDVNKYKELMKDSDGKVIDVVGAVSQNFEEIINQGDNITHLTKVIEKTKGSVSVEDRKGKLVLVYVDENGNKEEFDLSTQETETFVRVVPGKDSKGNAINLKYVYFNEAKIAAWLKANPGKDYKADMPESEGTVIDVLTDVTNNIGDIINKNGDAFNEVLNTFLVKGGTVFYGKLDESDPKGEEVLYSVKKDSNGKEVRTVIDLTNTIKEIFKDTNNELIKELKSAVNYDITEAISETNIKFGEKVVYTFSSIAEIKDLDAEVKEINLPEALFNKGMKVFDIKLYDSLGQLVTVNITDIIVNKTDFGFTLGSGIVYTTLPKGDYKVVVYFTK